MTGDPDRVDSVEDGPEVEWTVLGSRFLGQAFAAGDEETAKESLLSVRRRYHDATHHCWAWRLGLGDPPLERWDDDGEPSGTAGLPIAGALRHAKVTQAMVVVTRYFGGTKLGSGGLVRAYGEAARLALDSAPPRILWRSCPVVLRCTYDQLGIVEHLIARQAESILSLDRRFDPTPEFRLRLKESRRDQFARTLTELSAGRIELLAE